MECAFTCYDMHALERENSQNKMSCYHLQNTSKFMNEEQQHGTRWWIMMARDLMKKTVPQAVFVT